MDNIYLLLHNYVIKLNRHILLKTSELLVYIDNLDTHYGQDYFILNNDNDLYTLKDVIIGNTATLPGIVFDVTGNTNINGDIINISTNNSNPSSINIGENDSIITLYGDVNISNLLTSNLSTGKVIQLNANSIGSNTSFFSGLKIRDNNNNDEGYLLLNNTSDSYIFKSPNSIYINTLPFYDSDSEIIISDGKQFIIGDKIFNDKLYIGNDIASSTPQAGYINGTNSIGLDIDSENLYIRSGQSTGIGNSGSIIFQQSLPTISSSISNPYSDVLTIKLSKVIINDTLAILNPFTNNDISIKSPNTLTSSYTLTLPSDAGSSGYVLSTDGTGVLSWISSSGTLTPTLIALSTFNSNGIMVQTAPNTFTSRTIIGTTNQVIVTNGDGIAGNPTLSTPQDINTTSSPQFNNLTLTGQLNINDNIMNNNINTSITNDVGYVSQRYQQDNDIGSGDIVNDTFFESGTAQGGTLGTITLDVTANGANNYYNSSWIKIINNNPIGVQNQVRRIIAYNGGSKIATVSLNWTIQPTNATQYRVYNYNYIGLIFNESQKKMYGGFITYENTSIVTINKLMTLQLDKMMISDNLAATFDNNIALQLKNNAAYKAKAIAWQTYSSIKYKMNVEKLELDKSIDIINRLDPVTFYWKENYGDNGQYQQIGLIAEEAAKILPIATTDDSIDYTKFIPVIIKCLQYVLKNMN